MRKRGRCFTYQMSSTSHRADFSAKRKTTLTQLFLSNCVCKVQERALFWRCSLSGRTAVTEAQLTKRPCQITEDLRVLEQDLKQIFL